MAQSSIKVLDNVDELLGVLGAGGPQSVPDIARSMSIPRSSVYRLVDAVTHAGLAQSYQDGRIGLSVDMLHFAAAAARQNPLVTAATPVLHQLRDDIGQTVYLCSRREDQIVCLLLFQGLSVGLLELVPGGSLPPYAGATSRVILAYDPDLIETAAAEPRRRFTDATITSIDALRDDGAQVRAQGYVVSDGDVTVGVAALGVPVWDAAGELLGAISIAGIRGDVLADTDGALAALRAASTQITKRFQR